MLESDYIGKVIYNDDPTRSGRCKVRVFGEFDELKDEMVPWFAPVNSGVFSSGGAGSLSVPKVGDVVRVRFLHGDIYSGEYTALQCVDPKLVEQIRDDYDGTHVLLFDAERSLAVTYQPMSGLRLYLNGSYVQIFPDGRIHASHENNANRIEINGNDITITTDGGKGSAVGGVVNISSGNTVNVTGGSVNISSSDVRVGKDAANPAVLGNELVLTLKALAAAIDMKMPAGDPLAGMTFQNILSTSVKVSK